MNLKSLEKLKSMKRNTKTNSEFRIQNLEFRISVFFCLCLTVQVNAQVYSLDSVLSIINRNNPMLKEYDSKVKALKTYTEGAKSQMAPMVGIGTFMTPYPGQKIMESRDKGFWMISAEQTITNPAKLNANKNFLSSRSLVEEHGRAYQFNALRSEAKTYYYQWLVLERKMSVLKENEQIIALMLKLARIRYPYNQGSLGNIYKTEGRQHEVENMMLMTQAEIDEKKYRLKALMNVAHDQPIFIDSTMNITYEANQVLYDTASLGNQRSDIHQIDKTIEVMRLNQQLLNVQSKPDFKIRYDHMGPLGTGMPQQFTLMGMISIPIVPWASKMYKSESAGMSYEIEATKKSRESILTETRGMLAGMATQLNKMQQQIKNYETKILPALKKNYETLMLAYEENREQLPMVIDGWETMNMAQMQYLDKVEEYYLMIVKYEKEIEK
jgi:outer membrane protein, heavy metal efflux system